MRREDINGLRADVNTRFDGMDPQTTLKELAEQLVERRLDDHEQRLRTIEHREPH